jgi:capsular exopolysaccharide synthesis family protein
MSLLDSPAPVVVPQAPAPVEIGASASAAPARPAAPGLIATPARAAVFAGGPPSTAMVMPDANSVRVSDDHQQVRFRAFSAKHSEKLIISPSLPHALRETYRRLGATLHHAQAETGMKSLMVTSAVPDEGKTLTATNIALTLSESYQRRVLLIDADLRRPSLGAIFGLPSVFGLNEALTSIPERKVSLIQVSRHLSLLTAGAPDPDPMSALTSRRMKMLLAEASASFDWVIIDTPPVGILTDAKLLGSMVDGALMVIRARKTPAALVQQAIDSLGRNRIVGVVLNRADLRHATGPDGYYSAYYYGSKR